MEPGVLRGKMRRTPSRIKCCISLRVAIYMGYDNVLLTLHLALL